MTEVVGHGQALDAPPVVGLSPTKSMRHTSLTPRASCSGMRSDAGSGHANASTEAAEPATERWEKARQDSATV